VPFGSVTLSSVEDPIQSDKHEDSDTADESSTPLTSSSATVGTGTFLALGCLALMMLIVIAAIVFRWM
jgi:hypothetical protein